jgi:hypothetical protein
VAQKSEKLNTVLVLPQGLATNPTLHDHHRPSDDCLIRSRPVRHHVMGPVWECRNNILHKTDNIVTRNAHTQLDSELQDWKILLATEGLHYTQQYLTNNSVTNRNQPLLFFHMDPTNNIVWTRKSFIGSVVSCRLGFEQNLGQNQ